MSQTGHPHPKADVGGQRPRDPKKPDGKESRPAGSTKEALDAGKHAGTASARDAKK